MTDRGEFASLLTYVPTGLTGNDNLFHETKLKNWLKALISLIYVYASNVLDLHTNKSVSNIEIVPTQSWGMFHTWLAPQYL